MLMVERPRRAELLLLLVLALDPAAAPAQTQESMVIRLNDAVGDTIDLVERDSFHLFPNTVGFERAVIMALPGPEFYAQVTRTGTDNAQYVILRIMPNDLERIRFLIDNHEFGDQQQSDWTYTQVLASFWQTIEKHPFGSTASEPADTRNIPQPLPRENAAEAPPSTNSENRYIYSLHGATLGSMAGGCIGSHAGITYVRTEEPECLFPPVSVYHVDPCVFWGASCGITALGTGAGYALGSKFDRDEPVQMTRLKEGTGWRTGLALGALVPGAALGYYAFLVLGISRYGVMRDLFDRIENDPDDRTVLPMLFTGLCIAVESATIGYRIGRAIDRRNAEKAEAKRRALGR
jgi:hypothetical protein